MERREEYMARLKYHVIKLGILLVFVVFSLSACQSSTILPKTNVQEQASFDGNLQNSGIIDYKDDYFIISNSALLRYTMLCNKFQEDIIGVFTSDGVIKLNKEGMVHFMNLSDKNNQS